ncbi:MAG: carbohydrate kinase [Tepidibacillus sp.]
MINQLTSKEKEIIEILRKNPFIEQEEIANQLGLARSSVAGHLARLSKKGILQRGYILNERMKEIAVIGGANVDIKGIADGSFRLGSSNPGKVYRTAGGVARNVAENLAKLQLSTFLFTVVGRDEEGDWLLDVTQKAGVNIQYIERLANERTGKYLSILDENREQVGSISDMQIMERMDELFLQNLYPKLITAKIVFLDTNLPQSTLVPLIHWLKDKETMIVIDPVSAKKAEKLKGYLEDLDLITPNKEEAEILTGITIKSKTDLNRVVYEFFSQGVKQVVITLGAEGVFVATPEIQEFLPSPKVDVKDTTGAGDAFVSGIIYGLVNDKELIEACKYGHTMAAITLKREETVVHDLNIHILEQLKKEIF